MPRSKQLKSTGESLAQLKARREAEASMTVEQRIAALNAEIEKLKRVEIPTLEETMATKMAVVVNGVGILVDPREFSKHSYGFSLSNRSVPMTINGKKCTLTVGICAVIKGSKPKQ